VSAWRPYLPYLLPWWLLVPIATGALYLTRIDAEQARQRLVASERMESAVHHLDEGIARLLKDVRLARQTAITHALGQDTSGQADFFRDFLSAHPGYTQARLLDEQCRETLRYDQRATGAVRIPDAALQDKSGRYYCTRTLELAPEQLYLSALDLNIENGQVVEPHEPTLRGAARVVLPGGRSQGLVVLNFNAESIIDAFARAADADLALINDDGYWLVSPTPGDAFSFALGAPERSFANRHPAVWSAIRENAATSDVIVADGRRWLYRRITAQDMAGGQAAPVWYAVSAIDNAATMARSSDILLAHLALGALVLLILSTLAGLFARSNIRRDALTDELAATNARLSESLVQLEASLEDRVESAKLASLGLLVAGVAHELNTPLGAAMVIGTRLEEEMARLQAAYDAGLRQSDLTRHLDSGSQGVKLLSANLQRAARLITQFKAVASDRSSAERTRFELRATIDDVLSLMHSDIKHNRAAVTVDVPAQIHLDSYPGPLGQIVQNLVANALHHGIGAKPDGRVSITASATDDTLTLTVCDNGAGIDPGAVPKIWDPFFTTARHDGGTGLGLHLCRQLAEHVLGGRLSLEPAPPGGGTCMTLRIPRVAPATAPAADASA